MSRASSTVVLFSTYLATTVGLGCQPGLGRPIAANEMAHAVTQRDQKTLAGLSTLSFRRAVWDRIDPAEFEQFSKILAHGVQADVVDTQFHDAESIVEIRVQGTTQRYRIYCRYEAPDWFIDDVLREVSPLRYVSQRRQAEAVLAVRDFRRTLASQQPQALCEASSPLLCTEGWQRLDTKRLQTLRPFLQSLSKNLDNALGDWSDAGALGIVASLKSDSEEYAIYFSFKEGKLVVDNISTKRWGKGLRVILQEAAASPTGQVEVGN